VAKTLLISLVLLSSISGFFGCTAISNRVDAVPILQKPDLLFKHEQKIKELHALNVEVIEGSELSGGFSVEWSIDTLPDYGEWIQYMTLKKGEEVIDTLTGCSYGLNYRFVGWVLEDCGDSFIYSYGNSMGYQPFTAVHDKETAEILRRGFYVDFKKESGNYYYSSTEFVDNNDTIFCYNLNDGQSTYFIPPAPIQNSGEELRMADIYEYRGLSFLSYLDHNYLLTEHT